jgi:hypothetical protein
VKFITGTLRHVGSLVRLAVGGALGALLERYRKTELGNSNEGCMAVFSGIRR